MKKGKTFADLAVGMQVSIQNTVSEQDVIDFARVSGDHNPLHMDEAYAKTTQFGGRIAHGALTASYISAVLGNDLPGPGAVFMELNLKFVRPVRIGNTVHSTVEVLERQLGWVVALGDDELAAVLPPCAPARAGRVQRAGGPVSGAAGPGPGAHGQRRAGVAGVGAGDGAGGEHPRHGGGRSHRRPHRRGHLRHPAGVRGLRRPPQGPQRRARRRKPMPWPRRRSSTAVPWRAAAMISHCAARRPVSKAWWPIRTSSSSI